MMDPIRVDFSSESGNKFEDDFLFEAEVHSVFHAKEVLLALQELEVAKELLTISIKKWIIFVRNDFDIFINQEPQQAISFFLHLDSGKYLIKVWSQTVKVGVLEDLKGIFFKLNETFYNTLPCTGMPIENPNSACIDGIILQAPYLRSHSLSCQHIIQRTFKNGELSLLCDPCQVTKKISETYENYREDVDTIYHPIVDPKDEVKCEVEVKEEIHQEDPLPEKKKIGYSLTKGILEILKHEDFNGKKEDSKTPPLLTDESSQKCPECGKTFSSGYKLTQHQRLIHLFTRFECCACPNIYKKASDYHSHVHECHTNLDTLPCKYCKNEENVHEWLEHVHKCIKLKRYSRPRDKIAKVPKPKKKRKKQVPKKCLCEECGLEFNNSAARFYHIKTIHRGLDRYSCDICGKTFKSWHPKKVHSFTVHEQGNFYCPEKDCQTKHDFVPKFLRHLRENHPQRIAAECDTCSEEIKLEEFSKHRLDCITVKDKSKLRERREVYNSKGLNCNYCDKTFKYFMKRIAHENEVHTGKTHPCDQCDFQTQDLLKLYAHKNQTHDKVMVPCEICGKVVDEKNLRKHMNYVHECKNDNAQCPDCGEVFERNHRLKKHRILVHGMDCKSKQTCLTCGKICLTYSDMRSHMLSHAEGTFSCEVCGRNVKTKKALTNHMRTHTGEKPFK